MNTEHPPPPRRYLQTTWLCGQPEPGPQWWRVRRRGRNDQVYVPRWGPPSNLLGPVILRGRGVYGPARRHHGCGSSWNHWWGLSGFLRWAYCMSCGMILGCWLLRLRLSLVSRWYLLLCCFAIGFRRTSFCKSSWPWTTTFGKPSRTRSLCSWSCGEWSSLCLKSARVRRNVKTKPIWPRTATVLCCCVSQFAGPGIHLSTAWLLFNQHAGLLACRLAGFPFPVEFSIEPFRTMVAFHQGGPYRYEPLCFFIEEGRGWHGQNEEGFGESAKAGHCCQSQSSRLSGRWRRSGSKDAPRPYQFRQDPGPRWPPGAAEHQSLDGKEADEDHQGCGGTFEWDQWLLPPIRHEKGTNSIQIAVEGCHDARPIGGNCSRVFQKGGKR